jgi:hypothetical protein
MPVKAIDLPEMRLEGVKRLMRVSQIP